MAIVRRGERGRAGLHTFRGGASIIDTRKGHARPCEVLKKGKREKPLYYTKQGGTVVFAPEGKGLRRVDVLTPPERKSDALRLKREGALSRLKREALSRQRCYEGGEGSKNLSKCRSLEKPPMYGNMYFDLRHPGGKEGDAFRVEGNGHRKVSSRGKLPLREMSASVKPSLLC